MNDCAIIIFGIHIIVKYQVHDHGHIEWYLYTKTSQTDDHTKLLDLLLRTNYSGLVESLIREHEHYASMAEAAGHPNNNNPF